MNDPATVTNASTAKLRHVTKTLKRDPFLAPTSIRHVHSNTMMAANGLIESPDVSGMFPSHTGNVTPSCSTKKMA